MGLVNVFFRICFAMVTKIVKMEVMKYTVVYFIDVFIMMKQFETIVDWNKKAKINFSLKNSKWINVCMFFKFNLNNPNTFQTSEYEGLRNMIFLRNVQRHEPRNLKMVPL